MTRDDARSCLVLITRAYPNYYKDFKDADMKLLIDLWMVQFANCEGTDVQKAVMVYISKGHYAPTIADIKEILTNRGFEYADAEIWDMVLKAGRNGLYAAEEEWAKLPEEIRRVIRPSTIMEIAKSDNESLGYIKHDVLNAYHNSQNKAKQDNAISMNDNRFKLENTSKLMIEGNENESNDIQ